jgi:hypothetical protein
VASAVLEGKLAARYPFHGPLSDGLLSMLFEKVCSKGACNDNGVYTATRERLMNRLASDERTTINSATGVAQRA